MSAADFSADFLSAITAHQADFDAVLDGQFITQNEQRSHLYPVRVQYDDTDAGGIAYHGAYITFAERARSAFLRLAGFPLSDWLATHQQGFVIKKLDAHYFRPAQLHDKLVVHTTTQQVASASCHLQQDMFCPELGHIFARVSVQGVWVDINKGPKRFPQHLQTIISSFQHKK